jgi:hypothetical protein
MKQPKDKCNHCEACKNCQFLHAVKKVNDVIDRFIDIKSKSSDVVFSNHLIFSECMQSKGIMNELKSELKSLGVEL